MKAFHCSGIIASALVLMALPAAFSQKRMEGMQHPPGATSLASLVEEAAQKNPQILAASHAWKAASHAPESAAALPDTQVMLQHVSVGSPRPFAGYTNSDFAYLGLGISQEIPYPGKRKLRAEVASREAQSLHVQLESTSRDVLERIKSAYFRLAYVQESIHVFEHHDQVLGEMQQIAESRYRVGQGSQQEVLKAQLQHTKILQEITMSRRDEGQLEAQLKQLLDRPQDSPDIVAEPLAQRVQPYSQSQLLQLIQQQNPQVHAQQEMLKQTQSQVALAQKEFRPDFNVQYMYQNTDRKFRDYYILTFGINLPNRGRRRAELAEAREKQERATQEVRIETQRQMADLQEQFVAVQTSTEQLKIYKEGLIPQAAATFSAALAAYQTNRQDFQTLLSSFLDALDVDLQYQRELADHESGLAKIEALTGVTLP
ncbi:MAG: TolC family protein [Candidatus Angelobacter sp. Gp1-AA117]|nr:MAG: TolC family protein [Candidatus Angelobacter sp. Gp1-AA117]